MSFDPTHLIDDFSHTKDMGLFRPYHWVRQLLLFLSYLLLFLVGGYVLWNSWCVEMSWLAVFVLWPYIVIPPLVFYPSWAWAAWQYQKGHVLPFHQLKMVIVDSSLIVGMILLMPIGFCSFFALVIGLISLIFPVFLWALALLLACILLGPLQYSYVQSLVDLRQEIITSE